MLRWLMYGLMGVGTIPVSYIHYFTTFGLNIQLINFSINTYIGSSDNWSLKIKNASRFIQLKPRSEWSGHGKPRVLNHQDSRVAWKGSPAFFIRMDKNDSPQNRKERREWWFSCLFTNISTRRADIFPFLASLTEREKKKPIFAILASSRLEKS